MLAAIVKKGRAEDYERAAIIEAAADDTCAGVALAGSEPDFDALEDWDFDALHQHNGSPATVFGVTLATAILSQSQIETRTAVAGSFPAKKIDIESYS